MQPASPPPSPARRMPCLRAVSSATAILVLLFAGRAKAQDVVTVDERVMGAKLRMIVAPPPGKAESAQGAFASAIAEAHRVEALLSDWSHQSEIVKLNQHAGLGPVPLSQETLTLLEVGLQISSQSGGAFALTWAGLRGLWNFPADVHTPPAALPSVATVLRRLERVDDAHLKLHRETQSATLAAHAAVGLGALLKGYLADRMLAVLRGAGFDNALVSIGGHIATSGRKNNAPWIIGVQQPRREGYLATLAIENAAVVTSGDYARYFEIGQTRYHHIIDPRTGFPAWGCRSVTIVAPTGLSADAISTTVFVLGPERGLAYVDSLPDTEALIVSASGDVFMSHGMRLMATPAAPPISTE